MQIAIITLIILVIKPYPEMIESSYYDCSKYYNWQDQIQELASQYGMTREEMEEIFKHTQQQEQTLEWLKQPRVQRIVKHRKGRWVQVS